MGEKISARNTGSHFFPGSRIPTEGKIVQESESLGTAEMLHITPPDVKRLVTGVEAAEASSASRDKRISPSTRLGWKMVGRFDSFVKDIPPRSPSRHI